MTPATGSHHVPGACNRIASIHFRVNSNVLVTNQPGGARASASGPLVLCSTDSPAAVRQQGEHGYALEILRAESVPRDKQTVGTAARRAERPARGIRQCVLTLT